MLCSSRLIGCRMMLLICFLSLCPASMAMALTLRFAPLDHTFDEVDAFIPSAAVPVAPRFFRILVTRTQVTIGAEDPYLRAIKFVPPIRFQTLSPSAPQPVAHSRTARPRHQLRGPEAFLLRRRQNVAGKTSP